MNHRDFEKRFNRTRTIIQCGIAFIWVLVLLVFFGIGCVVYQVSQEVEDKGLKGVVEQIWYGKEGETK